MKKKSLLTAVVLLLATNAVSYWAGYKSQQGKDYEAACLQADFIRYIIDNFDGETEMANIGMDFDSYYWCY